MIFLKTNCSFRPLTGVRLLLSIAKIFKWKLTKIGAKISFLQSGDAQRDLYVIPQREIHNKKHYWLLLTSVHDLVSSNANARHAVMMF